MPTRTFLELRRPEDLRGAPAPRADTAVLLVAEAEPSFWRYLYTEVGRAHAWTDRLGWTDDDVRAHLADPAVSLWTLRVGSALAGFFELHRDDDGSVEIAYFGLLPGFLGQGLGKHLLTAACERAFETNPTRVWLHTSTLDHQAALPNYLARGFVPYRTEDY